MSVHRQFEQPQYIARHFEQHLMARPSVLMAEQLQDVGTCSGNVPVTVKGIGQYGPRHIMGTVSITAGGNRYPQE